MRSINGFLMTTLDGYVEGPDGDLDWHVTDDEFHELSLRQLDAADTLLFGRVTYVGMAEFWPTADGHAAEPETARRMNGHRKIVFSSTLDAVTWENSTLATASLADTVAALRREPSTSDVTVMGSPTLLAAALEQGLLDELRIMVAPVLLGGGRSSFTALAGRVALPAPVVRPFASGNVLLTYRLEPARSDPE